MKPHHHGHSSSINTRLYCTIGSSMAVESEVIFTLFKTSVDTNPLLVAYGPLSMKMTKNIVGLSHLMRTFRAYEMKA